MNKKINVSLIGLLVMALVLSPSGFVIFSSRTAAGNLFDKFGDEISPEIIFGLSSAQISQGFFAFLLVIVLAGILAEKKRA